jgi:hypothetical protein
LNLNIGYDGHEGYAIAANICVDFHLLPHFYCKFMDAGLGSRQAGLLGSTSKHRAIRDAQWKPVATENQPLKLYNIEADRSELEQPGDESS